MTHILAQAQDKSALNDNEDFGDIAAWLDAVTRPAGQASRGFDRTIDSLMND